MYREVEGHEHNIQSLDHLSTVREEAREALWYARMDLAGWTRKDSNFLNTTPLLSRQPFSSMWAVVLVISDELSVMSDSVVDIATLS